MSELRNRLLNNWTPMRMLRTVAGIAAAAGAVQSHDILLGCLAAFLLYQGIADVGCCGSGNCYVPRANNKPRTEDIDYEEIK